MFVPAEQHHDAMIAWLRARKDRLSLLRSYQSLLEMAAIDTTYGELVGIDRPAAVGMRLLTPSRSREWPLEWQEAKRTGKWP